MDHLRPDQLAALRARIEAERDALLAKLPRRPGEADPPATPDVGDIQDAAATEAAQLTAASLADHDRVRLDDLEDALRRITAGTYGVCEDSDEPIPFARLLAEPTARTTVEAQERLEREQRERDPGDLRRAY